MTATPDYQSIHYPVSPEAEQAQRRDAERERVMARGRRLRDLAVLCLAALEGAHGETAKALAEEGVVVPGFRGHAIALRRWSEADADSRRLEPDEKRAIRSALDAFNLEHALATVAVEVRKEIAKNHRKEARR